jgi:hypothetical protein
MAPNQPQTRIRPLRRTDTSSVGARGPEIACVDDFGAGKARQHRLHQRIAAHAVLSAIPWPKFGLSPRGG